MTDGNRMIIDASALVKKLKELETQCNGVMAHVIVQLLFKNHILFHQQSSAL